jgi:hypothetical protein
MRRTPEPGPPRAEAPRVGRRAGLARILAVVAVGGATLAACSPGTVRVAFRPRVGARFSYQVEVRTRSTLRIEDGNPPRSEDKTVRLLVDQTVLDTGPDGSVVEVVLRTTPEDQRTVLVRLDRAAQLVGLEPASGDTASLGDLGVAEVFPAAVGAPPNRPLRPGERWQVDSPVTLPASLPSRLVGDGRLTGLGVVAGRKAATVTTDSSLQVLRRTGSPAGNEAVLEGNQRTTSTASHALDDGAIQAAESTTRGSYSLRLLPPPGRLGDPIRGRLDIEVTSKTERA